MSDTVNCAIGTVTVAPSPPGTGTTMTVSGISQIPTLPARGTAWPAEQSATQTNSEVLEVTENASGVFKIVRKVEGPMAAREIKAGDQFAFTILPPQLSTPPIVSGTVYCSPTGNDAFSGGSWAFAKKTIQAAVEALPQTTSKLNTLPETSEPATKEYVHEGTVVLGAALGTETCPAFKVKSELHHSEQMHFIGGTIEELVGGKLKKEKGSPYVEVNLVGQPKESSATDIGKILINPEAPAKTLEGAEIIEYWEGEISSTSGKKGQQVKKAGTGKQFYTINARPRKNITELLYVVKAAIKAGAGVSFVGQGMRAGTAGRESPNSGTMIIDEGNGLTFWMASGAPKIPVEGRTTYSNFTLVGPRRPSKAEGRKNGFGKYKSTGPIWGFFIANAFGTLMENVFVKDFSGWGAYIGNNAGSEFEARRCVFMQNGNEQSKIGPGTEKQMTGGLFSAGGTPVQTIMNTLFLNNFGCGVEGAGMHAVGNVINHSQPTFYKEGEALKQLKSSGAGIITGGKQVPSNIYGAWMEGSQVGVVSNGYATGIGIHSQGIVGEVLGGEEGEEETAIEKWSSTTEYTVGELVEAPGEVKGKTKEIYYEALENPEPNLNKEPKTHPEFWEEVVTAEYGWEGGGVIINCHFRQHTKASIKESGSAPLFWINCSTQKSEPLFVERGKEPNVPISAAYGMGRIGGKEVKEGSEVLGSATFTSETFKPFSVTFVGGKYKNEQYDVRLFIDVEYEAGGKIERSQSTEEGGSTELGTYERANAGKDVLEIYLKASETLSFVLTKAKIIKALAQAV